MKKARPHLFSTPVRKAAFFFFLCFLLSGASTSAAGPELSWTKNQFTFRTGGNTFTVDIPGGEIRDACANGPGVILVLATPGAERGNRLRSYRVDGGKMSVAWTHYMQRQNPWKVRVADVDGDGVPELAVGVFNTARYHPVAAKRLFIYNLFNDGLTSKWLGSRLARPLVDFEFVSRPGRGDILLAVERGLDGADTLTLYFWDNFGFAAEHTVADHFTYEKLAVVNGKVLLNGKPVNIKEAHQ